MINPDDLLILYINTVIMPGEFMLTFYKPVEPSPRFLVPLFRDLVPCGFPSPAFFPILKLYQCTFLFYTMTGRRAAAGRRTDDTNVLARIHQVIGVLSTYGYRRGGFCFAGRQNLMVRQRITPNVFTETYVRIRYCLRVNPRTTSETGTYQQSVREEKQPSGALVGSNSAVIMAKTACRVRAGLLRS
ncbi:hypothetical protein M2416_000077 [Raoultella sp. BIGb0132]|nr:hypothetical protein [Raoultella sp. BIGb0132]MCS4286587.1 hypothetical protein [Raoultella terrigena]